MSASFDSDAINSVIDLAREPAFKLGAMTVRPSIREVTIGDRIELVEPRILQVLVLLVRRRGAVVSRDELIELCWNGRVVGDDSINRCIARIRRLSVAGAAFSIDTIPRVGYRLNEITPVTYPIAPLSSDAAQLTDTLPTIPVDTTTQHPTSLFKWRKPAGIAFWAIIACCLVASAYWVWQQQSGASTGNEVQPIAVLPFVSRNTDADAQSFADSISASIAATLNRAGLPVISMATTFGYYGDARSRAAEELNARYLIDGEVRRDGEKTYVVVRIDDGRSGNTLLAESFETSLATESSLSVRVAAYVASYAWAFRMRQLLKANSEVTAVFFHSISRHLSGDNMAAYLDARALANKYPDDAVAQSLFAFVTPFAYWQIPLQDLATNILAARSANERARNLDPGYGDAYAAASLLLPFHHWEKKEAYLRQGMMIDPEATIVPPFLALHLASVGRLNDAEALERAAIERDPYFAYRASDHYMLLMMLGKEAGAAAILARAEQHWPGDKSLILARFFASDFRIKDSEAARLMQDPTFAQIIEPPSSKPVVTVMLRALASRQNTDIDAASVMCGSDWISAQAAAVCLSGLTALGRLDLVFAYAGILFPEQRAASPELEDERFLQREVGMVDPVYLFKSEFASLRADPRFIALTERIGLMDYWRHTQKYPEFCSSERVPVCDAMMQ